MNQTTAETAQESTETKCEQKADACSLTLDLSRSETEKIRKLLASDPAKVREKLRESLIKEVDDLIESVCVSLEPPCGPFSGVPFVDLRTLADFIRDVDTEHGMGVEALDVVIGDIQFCQKHKKPFSVAETIFHATCEWDL